MKEEMTLPLRASRSLRDASRGGVVALVLLAVAGCGGTPAATTSSVAPASPAATTAAATPVVAGTTVFAISGSGNKTTASFQASGASVNVAWTYDCASASVAPGASAGSGSFTLSFYGTEGSPALSDQLASEFGATDSGTTNEPLNGATGPFHLEVDSDCTWSIKVLGTP